MSYDNIAKQSKAQLIDLIKCLIKATQTDKKNYYAKIESVNQSFAKECQSTTKLLKDNATLRYTLTEAHKIIAMLQDSLAYNKTIMDEQHYTIMTYREKSEKDYLEEIREDSKLP